MNKKILLSALIATTLCGCADVLKEEVFSQLDPETLFQSSTGVERVLFYAYDQAAINGNFGGNIQFQEEWTCDIFWETGGAVNQQAVPMLGFTFDPGYPTHWYNLWQRFYRSVRNCNLVLENVGKSPLSEETKKQFIAEARFIRASVYSKAYSLWGPVPLRKSNSDPTEMERATDEEMRTFIETELIEAAKDLPLKGEQSGYQYGRATKGAAQAYLCKFYLQMKQWQKCIDVADEIIESKKYSLWEDYTTLFTVDNEMVNDEYIWVYTCMATGTGNEQMCGAFPAQFASTTDGKIVFTDNMRNWARMDRVRDSFYNSFDPADERRKLLISEYINTKGETVSLLNKDNIRSFKYIPDVNAVANAHGNDIPVIRYADILLAKAEAINELSGPTKEGIDLIQQVRNRAGLTAEPLQASSFNKETLREHILQERAWEFYQENHRREDLLRNGTFIKRAQQRGAAAKDYHVVFPIPQSEIDANSKCKQNDGY